MPKFSKSHTAKVHARKAVIKLAMQLNSPSPQRITNSLINAFNAGYALGSARAKMRLASADLCNSYMGDHAPKH